MRSRIEKIRMPDYNGFYEEKSLSYSMRYVYSINRDELMHDLITKITEN